MIFEKKKNKKLYYFYLSKGVLFFLLNLIQCMYF